MQCPKCQHQQNDSQALCLACGLVFEKYYKYHPMQSEEPEPVLEFESTPGWRELLLPEQNESSGIMVLGRAALWLLLLIYSFKLIMAGKNSNYAGESFLHLVNLPFHEAGHVFFGILGKFIGSLGGTLGQFLMPAVCAYTFLFRQGDAFATSVACWWFAENFVDIAPYINDAQAGILPLVGGSIGKHAPYGFHDWEFLLTETGLISMDRGLAQASHVIGSLLMVAILVWSALLLVRQYKNL